MKPSFALLCCSLAVAAPVFADWDDVKARTVGDEMQVRSGNLWDSGKFVRADDNEVVIRLRTGEAVIPKTDVDEVRVFVRGRERKKLVLKTGLMGAGIAGGITYPVMRLADHSQPGLMAGLMAVGPGVASLGRKNKRIYKRPK